MELDLQVSPEKIMSREVELGCETELDFFHFELFLNSNATDTVLVTAQAQQLKQQLRSAQVAGQRRGDTALTLPLFWWRRSTVSPVFFGRYPWSSLHSFVPSSSSPLTPPSLISHLASVDVKQNVHCQ